MLYRLEFTTTSTMTIEVDSDEEAQAKAKDYKMQHNQQHHHGEKTSVIAVKITPYHKDVRADRPCTKCGRPHVDHIPASAYICASYI